MPIAPDAPRRLHEHRPRATVAGLRDAAAQLLLARNSTRVSALAGLCARAHRLHLQGPADERAVSRGRRRTERAEQVLHDHGRDRRAAGRRRGHAGHRRRPLRRLWPLPARGEARLHLESDPARAGEVAGHGGAHPGQAHGRLRLEVRRPRPGQGRHRHAEGGWQGGRSPIRCRAPCRSGSSGPTRSTSASTPARPWTTRTTRSRSPSPARSIADDRGRGGRADSRGAGDDLRDVPRETVAANAHWHLAGMRRLARVTRPSGASEGPRRHV